MKVPILKKSYSPVAVLAGLTENANHYHLIDLKCARVNPVNRTLLSELKIGQAGIIEQLEAEQPFRQRLMALGFRIGKEVCPVRQALFGGPLQVRVGSVNVMLRRNDAALIHVWARDC